LPDPGFVRVGKAGSGRLFVLVADQRHEGLEDVHEVQIQGQGAHDRDLVLHLRAVGFAVRVLQALRVPSGEASEHDHRRDRDDELKKS
jgi:hypothetical protein